MKKRGFIFAVIAAVAVIAAAGCRNEVDDAIKKLGGGDTERKEAIATIMSIPDARDRLNAAIMDTGKYDVKVRKNVAMLIGTQAESANDESAAEVLEKALKVSEIDVKLEIINALDKVPGSKAIQALTNAVEDKDAAVGKLAFDKLDSKVKLIMAEADKVESIEGKIKTMKPALEINPCNTTLSTTLSGLYLGIADQKTQEAAEDQTRAAALDVEVKKARADAEKAGNACGAFVKSVYLAWPFDVGQKINTGAFNPAEQLKGQGGAAVAWQTYATSQDSPLFDMRKVAGEEGIDVVGEFTTYAAFTVASPAAKEVLFRVGADAPAVVWVNGAEIVRLTNKDDADYNIEKTAKASLKGGDNTVIVQITGNESRSRFQIRVSGTDSKEVKGLSFKP